MPNNIPAKANLAKRWLVIILLVLLAIYIAWGANPDPRFALDKLQGLTPDEVIAQLGPPLEDPRLPKFGGWTPQTGIPLILSYRGGLEWQDFYYGIVFDKNHVTKVNVATK